VNYIVSFILIVPRKKKRITDNSTDKTAGAKNADGKRKRRPNPRYLDDSEDSSGEGQQSDGEQTTSADETTSAASNDSPADNTPPIRRRKKPGRRYTDPSKIKPVAF